MNVAKYPMATIAAYGPNDRQATKLVVAVFRQSNRKEPTALRRWIVDTGEIRDDPAISTEVAEFLKRHEVAQAVNAPHILGCAHEEGVDYPIGQVCPQCPFWAGVDRLAPAPRRSSATAVKPGRNNPCLCGNGRKYKNCCGANG